MEAISIGVVPQQPPTIAAPRLCACAANSAKYSGVACGIDDTSAGEAREAEVRQGRQRRAVAAHALERGQRRLEPGAVVRAHRRHVEPAQVLGGSLRRDTGERLRVLVEGQQRHDRQRGDAAYRLDRLLELGEVVERLHHEEVDAAALEDGGLLRERREALVLRVADVAERPDRAADVDDTAGDLARVARELHAGGVDLLELLLEEVRGELAAVRAERVRLDELGAGADEPEMEVDDALGGADVRLLGAAQARHGARDEHAHAAVGGDRRP